MPFGLKDIEINRLKQLFAADGHIETVILYGSRAKGTYKPFSDVDITLTGDDLTHENLVRLSLAIDDLLLPYQFEERSTCLADTLHRHHHLPETPKG